MPAILLCGGSSGCNIGIPHCSKSHAAVTQFSKLGIPSFASRVVLRSVTSKPIAASLKAASVQACLDLSSHLVPFVMIL